MGESFIIIIIIHEEIHFEEVTQPPEPPWVTRCSTLEPDKVTKQKKMKICKREGKPRSPDTTLMVAKIGVLNFDK